jgi:hypothetical protein
MSLGTAQAEIGRRTAARASLTEASRVFKQIGFQEPAAEAVTLLASLPAGDG